MLKERGIIEINEDNGNENSLGSNNTIVNNNNSDNNNNNCVAMITKNDMKNLH